MAKMRIIKDIYEDIKRNDPDTAITMCGLRRMVQTGVIPSVQVGRKRLINADTVMDYLNNNTITSESKQEEYGVIRRVS